MKIEIVRKDANYTETVDEFETETEAQKMLFEYKLSDHAAHYYLKINGENQDND